MTNGHIDEAEMDLILEGTDRKIDRYLVTSLRELRKGQHELREDVAGMREICETRGLMCPGMHDTIADPVTEPPTRLSRETWLMWTLGSKAAYVLLAVIVAVFTIGLNLLIYGRP